MQESKKRLAVVGVNGYLGRHLAFSLQQAGHHVVGYDTHHECAIGELPYQSLDTTHAPDWQYLEDELDAVFLFAGLTGTTQGFEEYQRYVEINELGMLHLLNVLRQRDRRPRVIFPSSRLVYRGQPRPLPEEAPKACHTVYAANKLAAEGFLQAYHKAFGIPYTVFRICVPYGNRWGGPYSYGTVGSFIRTAQEHKVIKLFGDGSLRRTLTHVEDICTQIEHVFERREADGKTFNIGGEALSLKEMAEAIASRFDARVEYVPWPESAQAIESGDTVFDDTHIRQFTPPPQHRFHDWIATMTLSV